MLNRLPARLLPRPIERYDFAHPAVPPELEGLRILHLTDFHIRRARPFPGFIRAAARALRQVRADLVLLTGDYMDRPGDERAALRSLAFLARCWHPPRCGAVGIFGNHDSAAFRAAARRLRGIAWPDGVLEVPGLPLRILAVDDPGDLLSAAARAGPAPGAVFTIALVHDPVEILPAGDVGASVVLAGHTHGGQVRPWPGLALHSSSDVPPRFAAGLLRYRQTLAAVGRGLGTAVLHLRLNCPPQIPLYTLRRGPLPGRDAPEGLTRCKPW